MTRNGDPLRRRKKRPCHRRPPVMPAPDSSDDEAHSRRYAPIICKVRRSKRLDPDHTTYGDHEPDEKIEEDLLGFCCHNCYCQPDSDAWLPDGDDARVHRYIQSCEGGLYHRCCCHGIEEVQDAECWATLFEAAVENGIERLDVRQEDDSDFDLHWVTRTEIHAAYQTACRQEAALFNADGEDHPLDRLRTHQDYKDSVVLPFENLCKDVASGIIPRKKVVILDAFAGVGSAILVLKRLGIAISTVIHVEHDKVSTHVYRWNHDKDYNPNLPDDGIKHVIVEKWEDFRANWRRYCEEYGPIDIAIGGPPCVDYSKVNAFRQGYEGEQGQYMIRFGRLIRRIERLQHPFPIFFLAENVFLTGDDRRKIMDAFEFDWDPISMDAQYLSPTRRKRHFITNIPIPDFDFTSESSTMGPETCLEKGFYVPAHLVDPGVTAKAQCFMASKSRIDEIQSLRMFVFKNKDESNGKYAGRPMLVSEREKSMGFPLGYIEKPVNELFSILVSHALNRTKQSDQKWKFSLPEIYHSFSGNFSNSNLKNSHRFEAKPVYPYAFLKLAPPSSSDKPDFFNAEEYSKHLLGLAYSIPVVEALLQPLQNVFAIRNYEPFIYRYSWENPDNDFTWDSVNECKMTHV